MEADAGDYLAKPFSARELLARVRTHLELARVRRAWAQELEQANQELEAFSYSVSQDLRAPLRAVDGFSKMVLSEYADKIDEQGQHYLHRVRTSARRMALLVDDLLNLSRVNRAPLRKALVNLTELARRVAAELHSREPSRKLAIEIAEGLSARGDVDLITIVLDNLFGNAWKFTEIGQRSRSRLGRAQRRRNHLLRPR